MYKTPSSSASMMHPSRTSSCSNSGPMHTVGTPAGTDILLVIEVSDTTLVYDRDIKMPLYARAGIPEAWLIDLAAERIEVYQDPVAGQYASARAVARGEAVRPL